MYLHPADPGEGTIEEDNAAILASDGSSGDSDLDGMGGVGACLAGGGGNPLDLWLGHCGFDS